MSKIGSTIRGEINQQVIMTLVELITNTIGENAMTVVLNKLEKQGGLVGRDLVIACSEEVEKIFGSSGAYAVLRQVGRELSEKIAQTTTPGDYENVLASSLNDLGFAEGINVGPKHAEICSCVFYDQIKLSNREPIDHPVCWAGWGFIEGFMQKIKGVHHIQWESRDQQARACRFKYYSSLTDVL